MIQIFVDSGANLSAELREQYNIHLLPMALTINDQPAPEGLVGHEYYEALRLETKLREAGHRGPILLVPHEPVTGAHVGPGMLSLYFHAVGK